MLFRRRPRPAPERRDRYRKPMPPSQGLSLLVAGPAGHGAGTVVDVSARGARVRFEHAGDPGLAIDDVVQVTIQSRSHGSVPLSARVAHAAERDSGCVHYGLEFVDAEAELAGAHPFFRRLLNRRAAVRVRPSLDRCVPLVMSWEGGQVQARVNELSATGIGVSLPLVEVYRLMRVVDVQVSFRLPGIEEPFQGPARIVNRKANAAGVQLGLAFDLEAPDGLARSGAALRHYVEQRMAEIQRWQQSAG